MDNKNQLVSDILNFLESQEKRFQYEELIQQKGIEIKSLLDELWEREIIEIKEVANMGGKRFVFLLPESRKVNKMGYNEYLAELEKRKKEHETMYENSINTLKWTKINTFWVIFIGIFGLVITILIFLYNLQSEK